MGLVKSEEGVLKLVYRGGVVECHRVPILAGDVLDKHPRHCIARPDVFTNPWIVVRPESILRPGDVFYVVSFRTLRSLLRARSTPPRRNDCKIDEAEKSMLEPLSRPRSRRKPNVNTMNERRRTSPGRRSHARTNSRLCRLDRPAGCINLRAPRSSSHHSDHQRPHPYKSSRVHSSSDTDREDHKMAHRGHGDGGKAGVRGPLKPCLRMGKGDGSGGRKISNRKVSFILPEEARRLPEQFGRNKDYGGHDYGRRSKF